MISKGDWYCPECRDYLSSEKVTFSENCDTCGCVVAWIEVNHVCVPIEFVKAVAHVGVDFGNNKYEIEGKWIDFARKVCEENKENTSE